MGANDSIQTGSVRDSFVSRFGEADAAAIEEAGNGHVADYETHAGDYRGSDPFKYVFLAAIGYECVGRFAEHHGIKASEDELRDWALTEGDLGSHDGDVPDYLSMLTGAYTDWISAEVV